MKVHYEKLLKDSNEIGHFIEGLKKLPSEQLTRKITEKKWSVLEVVQHLNLVYDVYLTNFREAIQKALEATAGSESSLQRTLLGRMSTYSMRPKKDKRRFKMKTFDFFVPSTEHAELSQAIATFSSNKAQFNSLIKEARQKDMKGVKVPTALGQKVKFYVPECMEFIIAHEQRHLVQIKELLD